jgi:hypothetical protein
MFAVWYGKLAAWCNKLAAWYRRDRRWGRIVHALFNSRRGVEIIGDDTFIRLTSEALELLRTQVPDVYALLRKHVGCIVSSKPLGSRSAAIACCYVSLLAFAPTTAVLMRPYGHELPIEQRAAILAHETYHAELYRIGQDGHPRRQPPVDTYSGERAETLCVAYECDVLRRLGVDEWDVRHNERKLESRWWESPSQGWEL